MDLLDQEKILLQKHCVLCSIINGSLLNSLRNIMTAIMDMLSEINFSLQHLKATKMKSNACV